MEEGPALLKYNGKDGRFKDEKDLKVVYNRSVEIFQRAFIRVKVDKRNMSVSRQVCN